MKFTDAQKEVKEFNNGFSFGVHKVKIGMVERGLVGEGDDGKEYIEITIMDPNDGEITDAARLWFTTDGAANFAFNTMRQIAVHNAKTDEEKEAMRQLIDGVADTEELVNIFNEKLIGGECWFTKYYDESRTYQNQNGEQKRSVNKNVYGYEPKPRPELMPTDDGQAPLAASMFPGSTPEDVPFPDASSTVPKGDNWSK